MDIKRILKKTTWKGEDAGKLLIQTLTDSIQLASNPSYKPVITLEELNSNITTHIKSLDDAKVYNEYSAIYTVLLELFNLNELHNQQILHGYFRLQTHLNDALTDEDIHNVIMQRIPMFMAEQNNSNNAVSLKAFGERHAERIYKEIKPYLCGIHRLDEEQEDSIAFARRLFLSACEKCLAYLALMDIAGNVYDIKEHAEVLKKNSLGLPENCSTEINLLIASLHKRIEGDSKKYTLVKKLFPPIDISEISPTGNAFNTMQEYLANNKATLNQQYPSNLLLEIIKMSNMERKNTNGS